MRVRDIQSGCCYVIISVRHSERALDVSAGDMRTIFGHGHHGRTNQRWLFYQDGPDWTAQSLFTAEYISLDTYHPQKKDYPNGTKVISHRQVVKWQISKENEAEMSRDPHAPAKFRMSLLDGKKSLHFSDHKKDPDLEISDSSPTENQLWYFDRVALVRDLQPEFCYKLINTKLVHRALDLSGGDHRTVIGWEAHGSDNQKWDLYKDGGGWLLRSVDSNGYVGPEGYHPAKQNYPNGTAVIANRQIFRWDIRKENEDELKRNSDTPAKFRLSVPKSRKCFDLTDYGRGCNAELWDQSDEGSQLWYLEVESGPRVFT